jgi:tetratricopeptide (TPR) repeat protein
MSFWGAFDAALDNTRKHVLNVLAILASALVVALVLNDALGGNYEVEKIDVAQALADRISGDVIASQLRDGIWNNWHKAAQSSPINVIQKSADEPDIVISGTNLPLRYMAKLLRRIFQQPVSEISGELLPAQESPKPAVGFPAEEKVDSGSGAPYVRLVLRDSSATPNRYFDETDSLDKVIRDAAAASLEQIDVYAAVLAYSQGTPDQKQKALQLARITLSQEPKNAPHGRAYLVQATALYQLGRGDEAKDFFKKAVEDFSKPSRDARQLSVAEDGLSIIYTNERDWTNAKAAVAAALAAQPNYDSALYHQVEIEDAIYRAFFDGKSTNFCEAEKAFYNALIGYRDFISDNPGFDVAYTQTATMQFLRLHWMRIKGHSIPECPTSTHRHELLDEIKDVEAAAREAITYDAGNPISWFQAANLSYELQDQTYLESEQSSEGRLKLLRTAVDRYKVALSLNPDDFYIWHRYGEALVALADLDSEGRKTWLEQASHVYCKSISTNKNDKGYAEAAKDILNKIGGICAKPSDSE